MSFITNIILLFPDIEDELERMKEVNSFTYRGILINLISINEPNPEEFVTWYGGRKKLSGNMFIGAYNYFDEEGFRQHLFSNVNWESPEYVQLIIKSEAEWTYKVYTDAGKTLVYDSILQ
ncbi:hypothetical protein [Xanthocytophaga agilis]|uniref:Uncharacterized protein n=1 Tax=Xanthocytophaga agilis TaxID=3048010 RepID=A0AAE3R4F8_9BACT|nr:hypothetical protein [Xanthocytophaga agilis]MDJ1501220.1 hypothetical protein [Xanthocytophaga agilis]